MRQAFHFIIALCIAVFGLCNGPATAEEPSAAGDAMEEVVVTGTASVSAGDYKKEALKNAMHNAVEKAVGVQVKSDTLVKDFQLVNDRILAHADGYVKKWEVQNESETSSAYQVTIKAWVGKGTLNKDLFMNGIDVSLIYDWIGKPRVMVVVPDIVDGKEAPTTFAQTEIESLFKSKGITVLSSDQVKHIQKRDAALAFNDPRKAVALGQRHGAEIVIVGKCISAFSREVAIEPMKLVFYTSTLHVKAYNTSNAEILTSHAFTEVPGETDTSAMGKADAAIRSIQNVVQSNAKELVFQVVKQWVEGVSKAKTYQVIVSGVQSVDVGKIERFLKGIAGVQNVYRRSFNQGTAELEVETTMVQATLADLLERNKQVPLDLVSDEPLRLSFEKKGRP